MYQIKCILYSHTKRMGALNYRDICCTYRSKILVVKLVLKITNDSGGGGGGSDVISRDIKFDHMLTTLNQIH